MSKKQIVLNSRKAPCKDCDDRSATCHCTCKAYADYRKLCDSDIKKREAIIDEVNFFSGLKRNIRKQTQKIKAEQRRRGI